MLRARPPAAGSATESDMKLLRRSLEALLLTVASVGLTLVVFEIALRALPSGPAAPDPDTGPIAQLFARSENPAARLRARPRRPRPLPAASGVGDRATAAWEVSDRRERLAPRTGAGDPLASELRGICLGDSTMFGAG